MMSTGEVPKDQLVWYKNPNANEQDQDNSNKPMYLCHVVKLNGDKVMLRLTDEEKAQCKLGELMRPQFEAPVDLTLDFSLMASKGLPDMVDIDELNHATLMQNLCARYNKDQIYTYVGPIILAMNPFKSLDKVLYGEQQMAMYKSILTSKQPYEDKKTFPPHIWTITALAYRQMMELKTKQAIVISGESGSGKTENAKRAMKFLTGLGAGKHSAMSQSAVPIEQKILDTNPVLESFGNAKTVRNNNSSRFGKYVLLYFTQSKGEILGARVKNYLLEKSRVVGPAMNERNYHVFYHLLRGADEDLLTYLGLMDPATKRRFDIQDFKYLKSGGDVDQKIINDKELYQELAQQFVSLGFTKDEVLAVWRVTAACLHLGELVFDDATYDVNGKPCTIKNMEQMHLIAKLLGFDNTSDLVVELVNKVAMPGITIRTPFTKNECIDSRDSLAKCLFDNLFNWLVDRMNLTILPENENEEWFKNETKTVGLLDIFGFENFQENNFEQMCINYVNEKLHKLYISAIFDAEKFELKIEGLQEKVSQLKYPDLTSLDVIRLLDEKPLTGAAAKAAGGGGKIGLFNIVNDCSTQKPRPTWEALMKKFDDQHKTTTVFIKEKQKEKFRIRHSAKEVIYTVKTFIERNVDEISTTLEQCIISKADPLIGKIFQGTVKPNDAASGEKKFGTKKTIWAKFSTQMQDLMVELAEPLFELNKSSEEESKQGGPDQQMMQAAKKDQGVAPCDPCQLHFIRCIKPNEAKQPDMFIHAMTLQQVTYMGVLESVDLKQKNFPYRKNYEEFYARYELLSPLYGQCRYEQMDKSAYDFRQLSVNIVDSTLKGFGQEYYALGRTKIFMMLEVVALFDKAVQKMRVTRDLAALQIKRAFSMHQALVNAAKKKDIFLKLQCKLKLKCQRRVRQRGHVMFLKVLSHVSKAVSRKKEEYEKRATQVFVDTYRKHVFRRALARRIKVRQSIVNFLQKFRFVVRMRKLYISYMMVKEIVDRAFIIGKNKANEKAVRTVQRIFRGFSTREKRMPLVVAAHKAKENLKLHVAAKIVQKQLRGFMVRNRLKHLNMAAQRIQGFVKMKWHREFYMKLRTDVLTIQRCVRRFLTRRGVIKQRLVSYLSREMATLGKVQQLESHSLTNVGELYNRQPAAYSLKKLQFFTRVLDMHVMTDLSELYPRGWSPQWSRVSADCFSEDCPVLAMAHGTSHTVAVNQKGKVFAWGWNDQGQCARPEEICEVVASNAKAAGIFLQKEDLRLKQLVVAQDRTFLLLEESQKVICWGGNDKGQLGLGCYDDQFQPRLLDFFSKQGLKVSMMTAGGDLTLCACDNGESYAWPFQRNGVTYSLPVKMPFSSKIKIVKVSCGHNFGFFISSQGLVYAHGKDNSEGQLGLGHTFPRDVPDLIASLRDIGERIDTVECGYKHVIAKSSLGKVYTWGWGTRGQLGHGHADSEISPRYLQIERNGQKERVIQIAAGFSHSVVMLENSRDLQWFGTCGHLSQGSLKPIQVKLSEHLLELFTDHSGALSLAGTQQQDYAVVKITASWSRSLSLTNVLIADLRAVNQQHPWKKVNTAVQTIASKWEPRDVLPPYIETVSGFFNSSLIKIPGQQQTSGTKVGQKSQQILNKKPAGNNQSGINNNNKSGVINNTSKMFGNSMAGSKM